MAPARAAAGAAPVLALLRRAGRLAFAPCFFVAPVSFFVFDERLRFCIVAHSQQSIGARVRR